MHDLLNLDLDNIVCGNDYVLLSISPSEDNLAYASQKLKKCLRDSVTKKVGKLMIC